MIAAFWTSSPFIGVKQDQPEILPIVLRRVVEMLQYSWTCGSQRLLQSVLRLVESVQCPTSAACDGIGRLSSDVTSRVCSVILSYLSAHRVCSYGTVSGPKEILESHRRLVDLSDLSKGTLWDDIGIVAGEEYRLQLCSFVGYNLAG